MSDITESEPSPATLSGRPIIEVPTDEPRTRVSRGTTVAVVLFSSVLVAGVALVLMNRGPDGTDVRHMDAGDCYVETDVVTEAGRSVPHGKDAPCISSAPRVLVVVTLPLGRYPGPSGIDDVVADRCGGEEDLVVAPTPQTWPDGDRTLVCIALP